MSTSLRSGWSAPIKSGRAPLLTAEPFERTPPLAAGADDYTLGTVRRRVGVTKTVEIDLEYGSGFDEGLALGVALILDQADAETRELRALTWND